MPTASAAAVTFPHAERRSRKAARLSELSFLYGRFIASEAHGATAAGTYWTLSLVKRGQVSVSPALGVDADTGMTFGSTPIVDGAGFVQTRSLTVAQLIALAPQPAVGTPAWAGDGRALTGSGTAVEAAGSGGGVLVTRRAAGWTIAGTTIVVQA